MRPLSDRCALRVGDTGAGIAFTPEHSERICTIIRQVSAAVIVKEGKVLLARRKKGGSNAGLWEFPGGKIREGETPQACLEREILEELGLAVEAGEVFAESDWAYPHGAIRLLAMVCRVAGGAVTLADHDRAEWVAPQDLEQYDLSPADIPIARKLAVQGIRCRGEEESPE